MITCPISSPSFFSDEARLLEELMSILHEGDSNSNSNSKLISSNISGFSDTVVEERKRRRMTSNRESARRSRWRKKRHMEDLTEEANRLRMENRELNNRLGFVVEKCHVMFRENEMLEVEALALLARLSKLNRVLVAMQTMQSPSQYN